ncbi:Ferredoxin-NADP reductase [Quadrisphaera granulorum]|uniref:Ferredoxin-NADP reductase n=1 Tax=Quadrisphaera granulorum TaxID=317664 RepID=A0A316AFT5_9ACTN|nr:PDR/VanB family oxidoreductase [Quadrisphaera granulorum]PWJ56481.1 ferredoxin-NADP reductase [Quadrisphaera granulorum]SZE95115.1 Ferredoxin-NADP reductase [Quadrisphaera granulorum]
MAGTTGMSGSVRERLRLVVVALDDSVPGIRSLVLADAGGAPLPPFTPGSHVVLEVPAGPPGSARPRPTANAYSLTGENAHPLDYRISVLRAREGGGSAWVHDLAVGDRVTALGPRSGFAPVQRAAKHLLLGAGIGVTPLVSHLRSAVRWGRDAELVHLHRSGAGAHAADLAELAARGARVTTVTDRESFTALLDDLLRTQPFGTHLYCCGPAGFMELVTAAAARSGWPASRVHTESFGVEALDPGAPFQVAVAGRTVEVPAGTSLLEALEDAGLAVPNLCRQGVCGECRVSVTVPEGGRLVHRDLYLDDDEKRAGRCAMACVSRALPTSGAAADLEVHL